MSMALDSAMDALAINNQALLTAANANASTAVWAWIAFLTAAISFSFTWKIKNSSINYIHSSSSIPNHPSFKSLSSSSNDEESPLKHLVDDDDDVLHSSSIPPATPAASLTSSTTFCWLENRRSGKFTLHYYGQTNECLGTLRTYHQQEAEQEEEEERLDYDEENESMKGGSSIMHKDDDGYYQIVLKMKTSEMGWYHHQDLSMLHGNVVRFWTQ